MKIPFVDLKTQYVSIKEEIDTAISNVINETAFISGKYAATFEEDFKNYLGSAHFISCANGTDSLEILLKAFGIGVGDEVIVPALSWISTSEAVSAVGATPVFIDIEESYYTIDTSKIEEKITSKTKAIIPVHLYGHPANIPTIKEIAVKYKLIIIEDCAQAHGAQINNKNIGTLGDAASFSFYPGKNSGAYGDAGGMATDNNNIADKAKQIANHGQKGKHNHLMEGRNSRLDGLQGAILSVKLKYLNKWNSNRIMLADEYTKALKGIDVITPRVKNNCKHVFHLYVIRVKQRDKLMEALHKKGIETAIHYPTPLPLLPAYKKFNHSEKDFPIADRITKEIISLPLFPELTIEQLNHVCDEIKIRSI